MDAQKWTHDPEPWDADTCRRVEAGQQTQPTSFPYHAVWDVNYARAVVCVNAMAGIEDPTAFVAALTAAFSAKNAELAALRELVRHCWVHSGYQDCGSAQMDSAMRALYRTVVDNDPEIDNDEPPSEVKGEEWVVSEGVPS